MVDSQIYPSKVNGPQQNARNVFGSCNVVKCHGHGSRGHVNIDNTAIVHVSCRGKEDEVSLLFGRLMMTMIDIPWSRRICITTQPGKQTWLRSYSGPSV